MALGRDAAPSPDCALLRLLQKVEFDELRPDIARTRKSVPWTLHIPFPIAWGSLRLATVLRDSVPAKLLPHAIQELDALFQMTRIVMVLQESSAAVLVLVTVGLELGIGVRVV